MVTDDPSSLEPRERPDHPPPSIGPDGGDAASRPWPDRVGPYRIERVLCQDELESVCLARHAKGLGSVVLRLVRLADPKAVLEQLRAFAETIGEMRHPHLVRLLGIEEDPSHPDLIYFVEEHVPGRTLARLLAETSGGLPAARVLAWADQLAQALDHLHGHALVHGALTPSSVIIDEKDEARLAGAGIKRELRQLDLESSLRDLLFAEDEEVPGPPDDFARDLYGLAALLYEALGGDQRRRIESAAAYRSECRPGGPS